MVTRFRPIFRELKNNLALTPKTIVSGIHMGGASYLLVHALPVRFAHNSGINPRRPCERCAIGVRPGAVTFIIENVRLLYGNPIDLCVSGRHEGVVCPHPPSSVGYFVESIDRGGQGLV